MEKTVIKKSLTERLGCALSFFEVKHKTKLQDGIAGDLSAGQSLVVGVQDQHTCRSVVEALNYAAARHVDVSVVHTQRLLKLDDCADSHGMSVPEMSSEVPTLLGMLRAALNVVRGESGVARSRSSSVCSDDSCAGGAAGAGLVLLLLSNVGAYAHYQDGEQLAGYVSREQHALTELSKELSTLNFKLRLVFIGAAPRPEDDEARLSDVDFTKSVITRTLSGLLVSARSVTAAMQRVLGRRSSEPETLDITLTMMPGKSCADGYTPVCFDYDVVGEDAAGVAVKMRPTTTPGQLKVSVSTFKPVTVIKIMALFAPKSKLSPALRGCRGSVVDQDDGGSRWEPVRTGALHVHVDGLPVSAQDASSLMIHGIPEENLRMLCRRNLEACDADLFGLACGIQTARAVHDLCAGPRGTDLAEYRKQSARFEARQVLAPTLNTVLTQDEDGALRQWLGSPEAKASLSGKLDSMYASLEDEFEKCVGALVGARKHKRHGGGGFGVSAACTSSIPRGTSAPGLGLVPGLSGAGGLSAGAWGGAMLKRG